MGSWNKKWASRETWDNAWGEIEESYIQSHIGLAEHVAVYLGGSVIELGCGIGMMGRLWYDYTGVDFSRVAIGIAKESNPGRAFWAVDLRTEKVPASDKSFDTVLLMEVVEHLENYDHLFREASRLARRRIVISVPQSMAIEQHYWPTWSAEDCVKRFGHLGKIVAMEKYGLWRIVVVGV